MESLHDFSVAHWDHEPLRLTEARSGPRVCDPQPARFMGRIPRNFRALDPEPGRDGALRRPRRAQWRNDAARCFAGGDIAARCPYQSQVHGKGVQSRQSIPVSVTDSGPRVVSKEISHLPERAVENSV